MELITFGILGAFIFGLLGFGVFSGKRMFIMAGAIMLVLLGLFVGIGGLEYQSGTNEEAYEWNDYCNVSVFTNFSADFNENITYTANYNTTGNYVYNTTEILLSGGFAQLQQMTTTAQNENIPYTTPGNYTYPSSIIVSGGVASLSNALNSTFYANYNSNINATYGNGDLTGTPTGGASVDDGWLNLSDGTTKYVLYNATLNADTQQTGTIRVKWKPNYSGSPSSAQDIFRIQENAVSINNRVRLYHTAGLLFWIIQNSTGGTIVSQAEVFSPVAGTTYEMELNWDITAGETRLFIDGTQLGSTHTGTGTRSSSISYFKVGSDLANYYADDFIIFNEVQHTTNYTPAAYPFNSSAPGVESYEVGEDTVVSWDSFAETVTTPTNTSIRYSLSEDAGTTYKYWNGSAWVAGGDNYTNANTAADVNTNIGSLATGLGATLQVQGFLNSTNGDETPELDNIEINYTNAPYVYYITQPNVTYNFTVPPHYTLDSWNTFTTYETTDSGTNITYSLSEDNGTTFQWYNGTAWVTSTGVSESNNASIINSNIGTFGNTSIRVKAYLTSNGTTTPLLNNVSIAYLVDTPLSPGYVLTLTTCNRTTFNTTYLYTDLDSNLSLAFTLIFILAGLFSVLATYFIKEDDQLT